jgi:hypothetical protein
MASGDALLLLRPSVSQQFADKWAVGREMSSKYWFFDRERNRHGPVEKEEIVRLIGEGAIGRETLIWTSDMRDWGEAGQVESFSSLFGPPAPLSFHLESEALSGRPMRALSSSLPVWGLFWRVLLVMLGAILIVPSPWTSTSFYGWLCERIALPDGKRLNFAGKPGDIWYIFIAISVAAWVGQISHFGFVTLPLSWILGVQVLKWFCANLRSEDGRLKLSFEGGYWNYIGWNLLLIVSFVTIIGWAWVMKFMMQWICQNVRGTAGFEFTATGLSILWRTAVFVLASIFVIPIPWVSRWYTSWLISQLSVVAG